MPEHRMPHPDLGGYVLGILEPATAAAFAEHLAECSACRAEVAELSALPDLLTRAATAVEPPADLQRRTLAAVDAAPASPRSPRRRRLPRLRRQRQALRTGPVAIVGAAVTVAALVAAAVAAVGLLARETGSPPGDRNVFTAELVAVTGAVGAVGAADAADARGTARLRVTAQGVIVDLHVAGLPAGDGGHYECWYVDAADGTKRVSAGTFTTRADGTAKVRMITAADPVRFPRIVVTKEPDDGNPAPGEPVLATRAGSS